MGGERERMDPEPEPEPELRNFAPGDMVRNPRGPVARGSDSTGAVLLARELHGEDLYAYRRRQMEARRSPRGR